MSPGSTLSCLRNRTHTFISFGLRLFFPLLISIRYSCLFLFWLSVNYMTLCIWPIKGIFFFIRDCRNWNYIQSLLCSNIFNYVTNNKCGDKPYCMVPFKNLVWVWKLEKKMDSRAAWWTFFLPPGFSQTNIFFAWPHNRHKAVFHTKKGPQFCLCLDKYLLFVLLIA